MAWESTEAAQCHRLWELPAGSTGVTLLCHALALLTGDLSTVGEQQYLDSQGVWLAWRSRSFTRRLSSSSTFFLSQACTLIRLKVSHRRASFTSWSS